MTGTPTGSKVLTHLKIWIRFFANAGSKFIIFTISLALRLKTKLCPEPEIKCDKILKAHIKFVFFSSLLKKKPWKYWLLFKTNDLFCQ